MTSLASSFFAFVPYVLVFALAALLPRRQGVAERVGLGIVAALTLLFVKGRWTPPAPPGVRLPRRVGRPGGGDRFPCRPPRGAGAVPSAPVAGPVAKVHLRRP